MEEKTKTIDEKSVDCDDDSSIGSPISLVGSSYYEWVASGEVAESDGNLESSKILSEKIKNRIFSCDFSEDELATFVPDSAAKILI